MYVWYHGKLYKLIWQNALFLYKVKESDMVDTPFYKTNERICPLKGGEAGLIELLGYRQRWLDFYYNMS